MSKVIFPRKDMINARSYRLLRRAVHDEALSQGFADGLNCGVLGGVLPEAEYLSLPGVRGPFVPPVFPAGGFPVSGCKSWIS